MPGNSRLLLWEFQSLPSYPRRPLKCCRQRTSKAFSCRPMVLSVRDPSDAPLHSGSQRLESGDFEDIVEFTQQRARTPDEGTVLNAMRGKGLVETLDGQDYLVTLLQVTGAILFWRGIWCSWDALFGFSAWSELAAILLGLTIMTSARFLRSKSKATIQPGSASSRRGVNYAYKSFEEDAT